MPNPCILPNRDENDMHSGLRIPPLVRMERILEIMQGTYIFVKERLSIDNGSMTVMTEDVWSVVEKEACHLTELLDDEIK